MKRESLRRVALPMVAASIFASLTAGATFACVGDCNRDQEVTIDELVTMVNIALGAQPLSTCTAGDGNGDGEITIEEIIAGVNHALTGCPQQAYCTNAIATIVVNFDANEVPSLAGLTLELSYPSDRADLPTGEIDERVIDVSDAGGFFDVQVIESDGGPASTLRASYLTVGQIAAGPLLEVMFDCVGVAAPTEDEFTCVVRQASDGGGFDVEGVSCQVVLDLE
ncbi:MAG: hypothetical protein N3C12_04695 [Candidatus Binatia bacterium]|nr:hypothetical protein [Candidatus Binatia bacterium]